ncbi:MAG TPA: TIGR03118 family protein [Gaiellaceae bacterium]|nr:TIGR03118 family protein [Gaiellaceae bacterium]
MGEDLFGRRRMALLVLALVVGAALAAVSPLTAAERNSYTVTPLVSDQPGAAARTDSDLVNGWGLTSSPTSPWWVSDNGTNKSTLYRGSDGAKQALVVNVGGGPTGAVFNSTNGFVLPVGGTKALFIFASEDGTIRAWNGAQGTTAVVMHTSPDGGIYKGLAIADTPNGPRLYAADFHNARVDVLDGSFNVVPNSGFVDPKLKKGYAPFGIQTIGDHVFVAYAKQDENAEDEVAGQGLGFVDEYDLAGNLVERVAKHGQLNAPWGLALAPATFGRFGGDLLVGNFGDGQINAFEQKPDGKFEHRGELRGRDGKSLTIDGLWALQFGKGGNNGPAGTLFFTAGPDDETHGLFGQINPS